MNDTTPTQAPAIVRDIDEFPEGYELQPGEWLCEEDGEVCIVRAASAQDAAEIYASYNDMDSDFCTRVKVNGEIEFVVNGHRRYSASSKYATSRR